MTHTHIYIYKRGSFFGEKISAQPRCCTIWDISHLMTHKLRRCSKIAPLDVSEASSNTSQYLGGWNAHSYFWCHLMPDWACWQTGYTPNSDDLISHLVFHSNWEDDDWLVVWNMFFPIIYGIILPIDFHILSYFSRWLKHVKTTNQWWSTTEFSKILWLQSPKSSGEIDRQVTYTRRKQTSECFNGEKFERPVSRKVPGMCFQMGKVGDRKERLDVFSVLYIFAGFD